MIRNLISNALKFSPPGSKVKVTAEIMLGNRGKSIIPEKSKKLKRNATNDDVTSVEDLDEEKSNVDLENQLHKHQYPLLNRMFNRSKDEHSASKAMLHAVDMIRISVIDSGAGISKVILLKFYRNMFYISYVVQENQKKLFNEIVQFNAAKLQQGKGSGIGLWSK